MSNYLLDILVFVFLLFICINAKYCKGFYDNYLSKNTTKSLKGILAIGILFHHISQNTSSGLIMRQFEGFGYLFVSGFFFITSFGVCKQYFENSNYKNKFLTRHILPIVIQYVLVSIIYIAFYNLVLKERLTIVDIIGNIFSDYPLINFAWYLINILFFYVFFYLSMILGKTKKNIVIAINLIGYFTYLTICLLTNKPSFWYKSSFILIAGIIYSIYEQEIVSILKKYYKLVVPICIVVFVLLLRNYSIVDISKFSMIIYNIFTTTLFIILTIAFTLKFNIEDILLSKISNISLELLLYQWFLLKGLKVVENEIIYSLLVIILSLFIATIIKKIISLLNSFLFDKHI